jgi:PAS domain S-box-containing protein
MPVLEHAPDPAPRRRVAELTELDSGGTTVSQLRLKLALEMERRERLLSAMLNSIPDATCAVDRQGRILYANAPALEIVGLTLEDAKGKSPHELGYPKDVCHRLLRLARRVFRTGATLRDEMTFLGANGLAGHYECILSPAFAPDGSVEFLVACGREITARKRSEEALKESVAEFRTLASAMPQIVWASAGGEVIYLNQLWIDYTGRSMADSLGLGWRQSVHPQDQARVIAAAAEANRSGSRFSLEARLAGRDGSYRWWLLRGVPVTDDRGHVHKWIGSCTDVDELKRAELEISLANSELRRQRRDLRALFDLVPAMVWVKDTEGRILQINQRAAGMSGLSVEQALGRDIAQLFPQNAARYAEQDRQIVRSGQPLLGMVEHSAGPDGSSLWFQSDKVPCFDENGKVAAVMAIKHDITDRKRAQDALRELNVSLEARVRERTAELALARDEAERANLAKSTFLATMSHEIRTPMVGLLGLLELLDLTGLDPEQRSTLRVARESGLALKGIIDGVLDFAKIEADSLELDIAPSSVRAVVDNICQLYQPIAACKSLSLSVTVAPEIGSRLGFDPLRLGQILNNFVANAIKFTERGSVTLDVQLLRRTPRQEHLRMTVKDTGIGIPADRIGRLFQPFAQADAHTGTQYGGTGLGLFIARRLAELMQGSITLESEPGVGTSLALTVAFDVCQEGSSPEPASDKTRQRLNALVAARPAAPSLADAEREGTLLLVVDDHPVNRMVLMRQVSTLGYAAESAADGVHALKAWESGRFAAIVTDCNMPRMNGLDLARTIRAREAAAASPPIPIIGCTANALATAAQACLGAGMNDTLIKPVALQDMCEKLDRWVPRPSVQPARAGRALPARTMPTEGLLDHALLTAISGADPQARLQVLADLRRSNDADAAALRRLVGVEDFGEVVHHAHRVRGASAMLGAVRLSDASAAVQTAAAEEDAEQLQAAMEKFEMELLRLNNHLDTLC